jgi:beta-fructofuranosidase
LWNWKHHPIAIPHDDTWGIWSGSLVIDVNNTSGFFPHGQTNGVIAIYTQAHLYENWEEQAIAYSLDGGYTFQKYAHNPVLAINSTEFRDPKVIWHKGTGKWVMVVAHAADSKLGFYTSPNLKDWKFESFFAPKHLPMWSNFECPGLVRAPFESITGDNMTESGSETWILLTSSGGGNPIWNGDGSVTRYFPGTFNGTHFEALDDRVDRVIDFGPDNYATAVFYNTPEDEAMINMGWATNLAYAGDQPSGQREGWRGILTSVRSAQLIKGDDGEVRYHSFPLGLHDVKKTDLAQIHLSHDAVKEVPFQSLSSKTVLVNAQVRVLDDVTEAGFRPGTRLDITFHSSKSRESMTCSLAFHVSAIIPSFYCERGNVLGGWTGRPAESMRTMGLEQVPRYDKRERIWSVTLVHDRSILEVFLNHGIAAGTLTFFPKEELDIVTVETTGIKDKLEVAVNVKGLLPS